MENYPQMSTWHSMQKQNRHTTLKDKEKFDNPFLNYDFFKEHQTNTVQVTISFAHEFHYYSFFKEGEVEVLEGSGNTPRYY